MALPLQKTLSLSLIAGVAAGITTTQAGVTGTPLTMNGSLVTGGVAVFDKPRRVIVTSGGNDTGMAFAIVGTDAYGRTQQETLTGASGGAAQTTRDFATVTSITPSANTATTVTAGTSSVGSTLPHVLDTMTNPSNVVIAAELTGTANFTVEASYDDLGPDWNINATPPVYFATSISAASANAAGNITPGANLVRLTINSGQGTVNLKVIQNLRAGGF